MAFSSFRGESGPSGPGGGQSPSSFGLFPRPSQPRGPTSPPPTSPSPPPPTLFARSPTRSPSPRRPETLGGTPLLPLPFDYSSPGSVPPFRSTTASRPGESFPRLGYGQNSLYKYPGTQIIQRPSPVTSLVALRNQGNVTAKVVRFQEPGRSNLPKLSAERGNGRNNTLTSHFDTQPRSLIGYEDIYVTNDHHSPFGEGQRTMVPRATQSRPQSMRINYSTQGIPRSEEAQRPATVSTAWGSRPCSPGNYTSSVALKDHNRSYSSRESVHAEPVDVNKLKRTRSPHSPPLNNNIQEISHSIENPSRAPASLPMSSTRQVVDLSHPDSSGHQIDLSPSGANFEAPLAKPTSSPVPKRTRSPSSLLTVQDLQGKSHSSQEEIEREMQAKAKRLARFKVELSQSSDSISIPADLKASSSRHDPSTVQRESPDDLTGDFPSGSVDHEDVDSSTNIIGLCPDMCPESERGERERKGDLDQYERVDGDRNQTSKFLAVKKYNRTAEREADSIRPMPVLLKTIDYLLDLLDQPYDDRFLGLYNFLWDRMRAIRMDLRMQHIFNLEAVKMFEQMIRLHIIAMHELCEYTKGEGFSEGFDAHLNIEQMNKTSAELFQLYDDHRKKGISIQTEKEFRGYYALLKLDKHPGYRVEPAELSLDLAKMTPEIRQTPEVLFARDVARACRTGNFIAFFRLARKASYLQACLMHAHFAKLRSQALASLHSSLQNNQGLPVSVVARWLAMEEEDIESLLEYHGFCVKDYEEPYMVKEGPFLNGEMDFPTKCSMLVHLKKSNRIINDVLFTRLEYSPSKGKVELQFTTDQKREIGIRQCVGTKRSLPEIDEETVSFEAVRSLEENSQGSMVLQSPKAVRYEDVNDNTATSLTPMSVHVTHSSPRVSTKNIFNIDHNMRNPPEISSLSEKEVPTLTFSPRAVQKKVAPVEFDRALQCPAAPDEVVSVANDNASQIQEIELDEVYINDGDRDVNYQDEEVAEAKLKLIIRSWKRRSAKRRELREQRQLAAADALNSLSLGPPIQRNNEQPSTSKFDIDQLMKERHGKHVQSWSRLNVAEVTAGELIEQNLSAKCLCWKIVFWSQMNCLDNYMQEKSTHFTLLSAARWLLAKLIPADWEDPSLVFSLPGLSIWRKWLPGQSIADSTCLLSVIKHAGIDNLSTSINGASAVLFLLSESIPLEPQKTQLYKLIMSFPSGSRLPLLILSDSYMKPGSDTEVINSLGIHEIDQSRIGSISVVFLVEDQKMDHLDKFYSDRRLREGLKWLACNSPRQPPIHRVATRDIVLNQLCSFLEGLEKENECEVGPDQCISVFNEALDQTLQMVTAAANVNPSGWPCPEIALLGEHTSESRIVNLYLPSVEWSTPARIEPVLSALRDCKLPPFIHDISWLRKGSRVGKELDRQRLQIEECLIGYLTESSNIMGYALARNEASVMLQKNAQLKFQDSTYYIVPNWMMIFRRIFNWRLMALSREEHSVCYVLEQQIIARHDHMSLEDSHVNLGHPSLDEMLQVGCDDGSSAMSTSVPRVVRPVAEAVIYARDHAQDAASVNVGAPTMMISQDNDLALRDDEALADYTWESNGDIQLSLIETEEKERLNRLLQQCEELQNIIDAKLSIFF